MDAIIEQMPGVELRKNGRIYVNGKFVETLLLNGKDLFNGNNQLMLENLPAFTVKDIAVYDHAGRSSKLMGYNTGDTKYVMDVRLKRQYRTGGLMNLEVGYGTSDRYLARLFGMLFSDNVSFSAYAGANNLSDAAKPGQSDGAWSRDMMGSGLSSRQMGGVSYVAQGHENKWEANGSVDVVNSTTTSNTHCVTQTYLSSGDNFYYGWDSSQNKELSVKTTHYFAFDIGNCASLSLFPEFQYSHKSDLLNSVSAVFDVNLHDSISKETLENIFDCGVDYWRHMLNRNLRESKTPQKYLFGKFRMIGDIRTKSTGLKNMLTLDISADYNNTMTDRFNKFRIDYSENFRAFGNQYIKQHPSYDWNYSADLKFKQLLSKIRYGDYFQVIYKYRGSDKTRTSNLYMLNSIADYDESDYPIGYLPPPSVYEPSIDNGQSYTFNTKENSHILSLSIYSWLGGLDNWNFSGDYLCDLELAYRDIRYYSVTNHYAQRTNFRPTFRIGNSMYRYFFNEDASRRLKETHWDLNISGRPIRVALLDVVDYINSSNPLYTIMGNPNLKDAYKFETSLKFSHTNYPRSQIHNANISYMALINALVKGLYYNTLSGHTTERPYNINGNWDIQANYSFSTVLGPYHRFEFSTQTTPYFSRMVDLFESYSAADYDMSKAPRQRSVNTFSCREQLKFTWKAGRHRLTMNGAVEFRNYNSKDIAFNNFSAWNSNVGVSTILNFPYDWELATDVSLYIRRGYLDPVLNTSDVIWNLRISKSLLKGKLLVALDGFDLLHQLSNISYRINSQARTEIVANTIPNYFLLHIKWNFNKSPQK